MKEKVRIQFDGRLDELAQSYMILLQILFANKTLSQDDIVRLVAQSPGVHLEQA